MSDRVNTILQSIKDNAQAGSYDSIISTCGILDESMTPARKAEYIKDVLNELERIRGAQTVEKVMKPCGHSCISKVTIMKAKESFKRSKNLDQFLKLLNEQHIAGGNLYSKDGTIVATYDKCYCDLGMNVKEMPPVYCTCSAGWLEGLFSGAFDKDVDVRRVRTILEGSDKCVFEINVECRE